MDVREKLVKQAISHFWHGVSHDIFSEPVTTYAKLAIEALEKEKESGVTVQEWISVKDRLPEPKELVLCIWKDINGIHYGFARYQHDNVWYVSNEGMPEVTHWMALPKKPQPPKGE